MAAAATEAMVRAHGQDAGVLVVSLVGSLTFASVAWRRVRPLACVTALTVLALVGSFLQLVLGQRASDSAVGVLTLLVISYSLGAYADRRALLLGAPLPALLVVATDLLAGPGRSLGSAVAFAVLFVGVVPVCAGRLVRGRRSAAAELRRRSGALLAAGDQLAREAVVAARLAVADQVGRELLAGMTALATRVDSALRARTGPGTTDGGEVVRIEQHARELLVRTREAVVSLAPSADGQVTEGGAPLPPHTLPPWRPTEGAASWTCLAGSVVAGTLLLELPRLTVQVALPVAVLACAVLALPLALAWVSPALMTAGFWAVVVLVDARVVGLDGSLTAVALALVPPFVAAAVVRRALVPLALGLCFLGLLLTLGRPGLADSAVVVLLAFGAGAALQEGGRLVHDLRWTAAALDRQRAAAASAAAMEEHARLARELHDALGHSLTVVVLQAGALSRLAARAGPTAGQAAVADRLAAMSRATHGGLAELRSGLGARVGDPVPGRPGGAGPDPAGIDDLVGHARDCGLTVTAELSQVQDLLDAAGGAALYRVVQESLTNVLRHAPGADVQLCVRPRGTAVEVRVTSSAGDRGRAGQGGDRRGLLGMRERVLSCGGELTWHAPPAGGFDVRATLPRTRTPA